MEKLANNISLCADNTFIDVTEPEINDFVGLNTESVDSIASAEKVPPIIL